jgi:hypothetical protein
MRHLPVNQVHRTAAARAVAAVGTAPSLLDQHHRQHLLSPFRLRPIRDALLLWAVALLLYALMAWPAKADPTEGNAPMPYRFTSGACKQLVQDAGRMIAWARWEQGYSLEKTRAAQFPAETPVWMIDLVQAWITDAYEWQVTDDQILQWASELGSVQDLPRVSQLNRHETIAIWLRRIARGCQTPHA